MNFTKTAAAAALTAAVLVAPAGAAVAADYDDALVTEWTSKTIVLNADNQTIDTDTVSFVGTPVTVPGDHALRTVRVTNNGPTAGVLEAYIINATVKTPEGGDPDAVTEVASDSQSGGVASDPFYDFMKVGWVVGDDTGDETIAKLADEGGQKQIGKVILAKGESTNIAINYDLPKGTRAGNSVAAGAQEASFDVLLKISGDGEDGGGSSNASAGGETGSAAPTGFELAGLAALGLAALGAGAGTLAASRKKKKGAQE